MFDNENSNRSLLYSFVLYNIIGRIKCDGLDTQISSISYCFIHTHYVNDPNVATEHDRCYTHLPARLQLVANTLTNINLSEEKKDEAPG